VHIPTYSKVHISVGERDSSALFSMFIGHLNIILIYYSSLVVIIFSKISVSEIYLISVIWSSKYRDCKKSLES
jgi:hypothetical protein